MRPNPRWAFPAETLDLPEAFMRTPGPWAACDTCRGLVEAGDVDGLLQRVGVSARDAPSARALLVAFLAARTGPVEPLTLD